MNMKNILSVRTNQYPKKAALVLNPFKHFNNKKKSPLSKIK